MSLSAPQNATFQHQARGPTELIVDTKLVPAQGLNQLFDLPHLLKQLPGTDSRARGRTTLWRWSPGWHPGTLVVRQFVHGGLLRRLWGTLFLSSEPMQRELHITRHARASGLTTCRPVALRLQKVFGPLLCAHYVTEEIPNAPNLLEFCRDKGIQDLDAAGRQQLARAVARTLAQMHATGIDHGDLNLKNLLVLRERHPHEVAVIDFKKARVCSSMGIEEGLQNLVRLDRSVVKWPASRREIRLSDRLRVMREYVRARSGDQTDWQPMARRFATRHPLHTVSRM